MRYEVQNLMVTAQDAGGNSLPPPGDATFVMIEAAQGSSVSAIACGGSRTPRQIPAIESAGQMKVASFVIVSTTAGRAAPDPSWDMCSDGV